MFEISLVLQYPETNLNIKKVSESLLQLYQKFRMYPYCQFHIISINIDQFDLEINSNSGGLFIVKGVISKSKEETITKTQMCVIRFLTTKTNAYVKVVLPRFPYTTLASYKNL